MNEVVVNAWGVCLAKVSGYISGVQARPEVAL